jgi:hypothetical protein
MNLRFLKNAPYLLSISMLFLALLLVACAEDGLGGGGEDGGLPGVTEEPLPGLGGETPGGGAVEPTTEAPEVTPPEAEGPQTGTVESVDPGAGVMTLTLADGQTMEVNVDSSTEITADGADATLEDIQPGAMVEVEVDPATNTATSITVQGGGGT